MKVDSSTAFKARIRINDLRIKTANNSGDSSILSSASSLTSSAISALSSEKSATCASNSIASAANSAGTLFSTHALGTTTSNIIPFALDTAASAATPATIVSVQNHPSIFASALCTIGSFFENLTKKEPQVKDPS